MSKESFEEYTRCLYQHELLLLQGHSTEDSPEIDKLFDKMDNIWEKMSAEERKKARKLSADLNQHRERVKTYFYNLREYTRLFNSGFKCDYEWDKLQISYNRLNPLEKEMVNKCPPVTLE